MSCTWTRIDEGYWLNLAYCIDATEDEANPGTFLVTVSNGKVVRVPPGHADDLRMVLNFLAARIRAETDPSDAPDVRNVRAPPTVPLSRPESWNFRSSVRLADDLDVVRIELQRNEPS